MFEPDELSVVMPPAWSVEASNTPMTCIDYSSDGALIAYSNHPGVIDIVSSYDGDVKRKLEQQLSNYPIMGCRFHPSEDSLLISATKDGFLFIFNILTGEVVQMTRHLGSNLLSMNIDTFGEVLAIACADGSIRLYDVENLQRTKTLVKMISRTPSTQAINVYGLTFHPEDSNVILAAGKNDKVWFWDIRTGSAEKSIAGPHIRGQGIDIHDNNIITASARDKKQLEVWDYGTTKKIKDIQFDTSSTGKECFANTVRIARNGLDVVAGGSGTNFAQAFEFNHSNVFGQTSLFQSPVVTIAVSPFGSAFLAGTENGDATCHMIRLKQP